MEIARNKIYPFITVFLCVRDILLDRDRESDEETDRYVVLKCFFAETSTAHHHNVVLRRSLSHTHTLTHMTGQQWLTGQVVPDFSGFANIFDPKKRVARIF